MYGTVRDTLRVIMVIGYFLLWVVIYLFCRVLIIYASER